MAKARLAGGPDDGTLVDWNGERRIEVPFKNGETRSLAVYVLPEMGTAERAAAVTGDADVVAEFLEERVAPPEARDDRGHEDWRRQEHVLEAIRKERRRQAEKWAGTPGDAAVLSVSEPFRLVTILTEEVGEIARAALELLFELEREPISSAQVERWMRNYRQELIECAAVAVAAVEGIDRQEADRRAALRTQGQVDQIVDMKPFGTLEKP